MYIIIQKGNTVVHTLIALSMLTDSVDEMILPSWDSLSLGVSFKTSVPVSMGLSVFSSSWEDFSSSLPSMDSSLFPLCALTVYNEEVLKYLEFLL